MHRVTLSDFSVASRHGGRAKQLDEMPIPPIILGELFSRSPAIMSTPSFSLTFNEVR